MSSSDIDLDIDDPLPPDRDLRKAGAVFAAVLLLVVAAAIVIPTVEAGAKSPSGLTAAGAASTVRQFVDEAVVQGDGYSAPVTFTLRPATAADRTIYRAPDAPWRIAAGAERVVAGGT
jgi:hypothetical protein